MNDQLWIIYDPIGNANNHPLLYNIALAGCVRVGLILFGSANIGFALYVLAQMFLCAGVVAFCVVWLRYRGVGKIFTWLVVAFFAFVPIISNYFDTCIQENCLKENSLCSINRSCCKFCSFASCFFNVRPAVVQRISGYSAQANECCCLC